MMRTCLFAAAFGIVASAPTAAVAESDWDLYALRLVNRARGDPAGEAGRIGSPVTDGRLPVPPLAYSLLVDQAAGAHNQWMHANLNNVSNGYTLPSFTHYETLDGSEFGTPATSTPFYTGVKSGARITAAGYSWSVAGENILAIRNPAPIPVDAGLIERNHRGWWESAGHHENMLYRDFAVFGYEAATETGVLIGGQAQNLHFATQNFARPRWEPYTHVLGLLYEDLDGSGGWTPLPDGDPMREGLGGIGFEVRPAAGGGAVASGSTTSGGAISAQLADGLYDLFVLDAALPGGQIVVEDIRVAGLNVDAGDILVPSGPMPGDTDDDGDVDALDYLALKGNFGTPSGAGREHGDMDDDGDVDYHDYVIMRDNVTGPIAPPAAAVPEPACLALLAAGALPLLRRHSRFSRR